MVTWKAEDRKQPDGACCKLLTGFVLTGYGTEISGKCGCTYKTWKEIMSQKDMETVLKKLSWETLSMTFLVIFEIILWKVILKSSDYFLYVEVNIMPHRSLSFEKNKENILKIAG